MKTFYLIGNTLKKKKIVNWNEYTKALKKRGSITFWINDDTVSTWYAKIKGLIHEKRKYSDTSILTCLKIRSSFYFPLRQTEGFIRSIFNLMDITLHVSNYSTLSKRSVYYEKLKDFEFACGSFF